jgi:hypothetical protein
MLCSAFHAFGYGRPFLAYLQNILQKSGILFLCPLSFLDVGVKVVSPSLPTLFGSSEVLLLGLPVKLLRDVIPFVIGLLFSQ